MTENLTEHEQLEAVKQDGWFIKYFKNPSDQVQLAAVKENGHAIKYIKNPSDQVQLVAIKQDGGSIQFIENPSEQVLRLLLENCTKYDLLEYAKESDALLEAMFCKPKPKKSKSPVKLGQRKVSVKK
jgi:hypothetical protein